MMTFGSLFAGIGGIDLGLESVGMRCAWQVEKDRFCRQVLSMHWPNVKRYGDIHDDTGEMLKSLSELQKDVSEIKIKTLKKAKVKAKIN